jgi:hypothetical protein|tara:strand:- start:13 stop:195 length:183 start_codon:yes stop_codon:yes gene_type:complete
MVQEDLSDNCQDWIKAIQLCPTNFDEVTLRSLLSDDCVCASEQDHVANLLKDLLQSSHQP